MLSSRIPLSRVLIVVLTMAVVAGVGVSIATARDADGTASARPLMAAQNSPVEKPRYVAMGSSFASGPESNRRGPSNCGRSQDNYPNKVADALGYRLVDVTCAGSTTSDILKPSKRYHKPPQIDAVTSDTDVVTLTTGGNDVGYIGRLGVQSCVNLAMAGVHPLHCNANRTPSPAPAPASFASVERRMEQIVHAIRARAPKAKIVFVDYPPVVSVADVACRKLPLAPWEIVETGVVADSLAAVTAQAAHATGSMLVQPSQTGKAHTVCSPDPWLQGFPGTPPYHPTNAGKNGVARLVIDKMR
ncbi:SGNH/GDSL hydrolase family protein [Gordonia sp. HY002]|uniref:SGNH/GDSL hydrolase family protein n=1 Tax=Gordonia zhenghanii TaxID=2911516 RepID=UPI001EF04F8C|nr:SGNH/GDSL hydrolase family protein [Gordonia zhenghanii]MCF8568987.1 SGNH/GDSL hydrolase family protein [Gordonia zhenghanii]MCF8606958.1 SGNH/GDSL hydrolase family protein [Gordonia zhenghanii]